MAGESILVVDDDRNNLKLISLHLKRAGYIVDLAQDGEEALEQIVGSPPDLIILDVFMPSMSGLELAETLKNDDRTKAIPLLAMSAYHEYETGAPRRDLAADAFLKKPIFKDELLEKVRSLLG